MKKVHLAFILAAGLCVALPAESIRNNFGGKSVSDPGRRIIAKTNGSGYTIWTSDPVRIDPKNAYTGKVGINILDRSPGAHLSVRLVSLNEDMLEIGVSAEGWGTAQTVTACGKETIFRYVGKNSGARFLRFELALAGNPVKIQIDDFSIEPTSNTLYPGVYTPKLPYPDRDRELAAMRKLQPATGKIAFRNGIPIALIDGRETLLKSYKGSRDYGELAKAGANFLHTFTAGATLFWDKVPWDMAAMRADGTFDFSRMERELLFIHHYAPGARVLLNLNIDVGDDFFRKYPDSIFRNEKGKLGVRQYCAFAGFDVPGPDPKKNRHWAVSYSSEDYQKYVCEGLKRVGEFLKNSPAGNIVAGIGFNGGHDDQFFQWEYSAWRGQGDYSPAAIQAFRKYLTSKYQTDEALQNAWSDRTATLGRAELFLPREWQSNPVWSSGAKGLSRKISDGREFMSLSLARMLNRFARQIKQAIGRDILVGTYYSSPIWAQAGRSSLAELARNGGIDIVFQVSEYSHMRRRGGIGASANFTIAGAHINGMLYQQEMDHRTPRSQVIRGWDRHQAAEPATVREFQDQAFRDAGATLAYGGDGFFYFDMFDSWYNDPDVLKVIETTYKAADWASKYRFSVPRQEAAVFLDEGERLYAHEPRSGARLHAAWRMSGVTPDVYLLEDLLNPKLPDYKMYIVPGAQTMTPEIAEALKKIACRPGKVLILTGSCGAITGENAGSCANMLQRFNIRVTDHKTKLADGIVVKNGVSDQLLGDSVGRLSISDFFFTAEKSMTFTNLPYFQTLDDPSFKILGVWSASGKPALGIRRTNHGTLLYSAEADGLTPRLIHQAAVEAGILPHSEAGNSIAVGRGVASIARLDQPVTLHFAREMEFFDPETGRKIGEGRSIPVPCEPRESRLICYRLKK